MPTVLQHRRMVTASRTVITALDGELLVDETLNHQLYVGDGATAGGILVGGLLTADKTANYTVLATDTGTHFNNGGATGSVTFTLPAAAAFLRYGFAIFAAQNVTITAAGSDLIKSDVFSGGSIASSGQWSFIEIEAHGSGFWIITKATGAWG